MVFETFVAVVISVLFSIKKEQHNKEFDTKEPQYYSVNYLFPKAFLLYFSVSVSSVPQVKVCRCRGMSSAACCTPRARCVPKMCCGLRCRQRGPTAVYKPSCKYFNYPLLELKSTQQSAGMENMPLIRGGQSPAERHCHLSRSCCYGRARGCNCQGSKKGNMWE